MMICTKSVHAYTLEETQGVQTLHADAIHYCTILFLKTQVAREPADERGWVQSKAGYSLSVVTLMYMCE